MDPMGSVMAIPETGLPDHTQLPDKDGSIVTNFQEHHQSNLLTSCLLPRLRELHRFRRPKVLPLLFLTPLGPGP